MQPSPQSASQRCALCCDLQLTDPTSAFALRYRLGAWRLRITSNIDVDRRITNHLTSNSLRAFPRRQESHDYAQDGLEGCYTD